LIQANDFRRQWEDIREDALAAFERVGSSGWYVLGEEVRTFEQELAAFWGFPHAAGVGSGLDAIEISLRALGCGPGSRVLTTPISAFATTLAIVKTGAVPVFADTDEHGLIDLEQCEALLRRRSDIRFFVPVHLYGFALDSNALLRLRDDHELRMLEDCAQSVAGAGAVAATSFYPTKNLGAIGDGGAILMQDAALDTRVRVLREQVGTRHPAGVVDGGDERQATLATLLDFKRAEFVQEGMRWFDLLRYNLPVTHNTTDGQKLVLAASDKRRVFQIPESARLSGVELNPR